MPQTTLTWHFSWLFCNLNWPIMASSVQKNLLLLFYLVPFWHWSAAKAKVKTHSSQQCQGNPVLVAAWWGAVAHTHTHSPGDYNCFCQEKKNLPPSVGFPLPCSWVCACWAKLGEEPWFNGSPQGLNVSQWSYRHKISLFFPYGSECLLQWNCSSIQGRAWNLNPWPSGLEVRLFLTEPKWHIHNMLSRFLESSVMI